MDNAFLTRTNTEFERLAIADGVNLSDGHARLPLDEKQMKSVAALPELFARIGAAAQTSLETDFTDAYFSTMGQSSALQLPYFLNYSASSGIQIAAKILQRRAQVTGLIEPVFDNIRHFLEWEGLSLYPVGEDVLVGEDSALLRLPVGSSLWIVSPNNPTGTVVSRDRFDRVVDICRSRRLCLVIDASFRPHSTVARSWDMYEVLAQAGLDFIVIEDTGKTWPLMDLKVGVMVCSMGLRPIAHQLHDQLLLNVSPVILALLTDLIQDFGNRGYQETIGRHLDRNRALVHAMVERSHFDHVGDCRTVPLELLSLPADIDPEGYWRNCRESGVHVLPAHNYYWSRSPDRPLFRVPLSRPTEELALACDVLSEVASWMTTQ